MTEIQATLIAVLPSAIDSFSICSIDSATFPDFSFGGLPTP